MRRVQLTITAVTLLAVAVCADDTVASTSSLRHEEKPQQQLRQHEGPQGELLEGRPQGEMREGRRGHRGGEQEGPQGEQREDRPDDEPMERHRDHARPNLILLAGAMATVGALVGAAVVVLARRFRNKPYESLPAKEAPVEV